MNKERVCISGSRGFKNLHKIDYIIKTRISSNSIIVHGGAVGVDQRAEEVAKSIGIETEIWKPDWKKYGRAAGPIRNREMVRTCDCLIAFWDGNSKGTKSTIDAAKEFRIATKVINDIKGGDAE